MGIVAPFQNIWTVKYTILYHIVPKDKADIIEQITHTTDI